MASQRQTIMDYLADTLFPSIDAGGTYTNTVVISQRGLKTIDALQISDFPALFVASGNESRENVTNKDFMSILSVFVVGYVRKSTSTLHVQIELDKLIEDVTKALYADPSQTGKASWTEIKSIVTDNGDDTEQAAFSMQVDFRYKNPGTAP